jgi:hypothetical protein
MKRIWARFWPNRAYSAWQTVENFLSACLSLSVALNLFYVL